MNGSLIAGYVSAKLFHPKMSLCFRYRRFGASHVPMPKATMHEYYCLMPGKNQIWRPGQIASMEPKSKPKAMRGASNT